MTRKSNHFIFSIFLLTIIGLSSYCLMENNPIPPILYHIILFANLSTLSKNYQRHPHNTTWYLIIDVASILFLTIEWIRGYLNPLLVFYFCCISAHLIYLRYLKGKYHGKEI